MLLDNNTNIPDVDVNGAIDLLFKLYQDAVTKGIPFDQLPTFMLWGPPGVGKSSLVKQTCSKLEQATGKKVNLTDIRLVLFTPPDFRGIPYADESHRFTQWLMPKILDLPDDPDIVNIIVLDEISSATQQMQATAYQICLDRCVGEHKLPDNTIVIAAGNRTTDHSVAYKMPAALANRMLHLNVDVSFDAWHKWAINNLVDERIVGYLSFDNSHLCEEPDNNSLAYPTPRSWSFVSTVLKTTGLSVSNAYSYIASAVGADTALAFESWCEIYSTLPRTRDIFKGVCKTKPSKPDALYALISSMTAYVAEHKDSISPSEIENAFSYARNFPNDYVMTFFTNLSYIEDIKLKLIKCPSVMAWLNKRSLG